jgi:hypothetical protein
LNFIDHHNARVPVLAGLGQVGPHEVLETGGVSLKRLSHSGIQKVDEQSLGPEGGANEGAFAGLAWPHQKSTAMLQTGTEVEQTTEHKILPFSVLSKRKIWKYRPTWPKKCLLWRQ